MATSWWNPFSSKTNDDFNSAYDRAFATNPTIANQDDYFDAQHSMYGGGQNAYTSMLDSVGSRFLKELGVEIGDQNARRNLAQNLVNLRNKAITKSAISGDLSGTGTMRDAFNTYGGDWLRTGQTPISPFKDALATIQSNKAVASQSGDMGNAYLGFINKPGTQRALESEALSQYSGPYRSILADQFEDARKNAGGFDPIRGFYGTLADYSPFSGGNVIGSPNWTPVAPAGPDPNAPPIPGPANPNLGNVPQPQPALPPLPNGVDLRTPEQKNPYAPVFDRNAAQAQVAQAFRSVMGTDADPAQLKYWTDRAETWGLDEALRRMGDNDATRAMQIHRQNGGPTTPPKIQGSGDINGLNNYAVWLIDAGILHPSKQLEWVQNMANMYRNASL